MLRRRFHAMGTDCELFLKARPRPEALRAMAEAEREVRRLETHLLAVRSRLGALGAEPARHAAGRAGAARGRRSRARRQASDGRPLRPDGARRARRRRLRPHVRGGGVGRSARWQSPRVRGCSLRRVGPCGSQDADDRARSRGPPRSRRDRQGLRGGSRREDPRGARPVPGRRRRRHRRPWRRVADRARHRRRHAHARARRRCGRDLRPRPSPLDAGQRGAAPHHRPRHRLAGDGRPASGDRRRGDRGGSGGASESPLPRRRGGGRTRGERHRDARLARHARRPDAASREGSA